MSSKTRLLILLISTPLVLFVGVGGLLGASAPPAAGQQAFADLRLFGQIVQLITSSYVEPVDVDKVMDGAMRGLADGLDPSSAYLLPDEKCTRSKRARRCPPATSGSSSRASSTCASSACATDRRPRRPDCGRATFIRDDRRQADARHVGGHGHAPAARRAGHRRSSLTRHARQRGRPARRDAHARSARPATAVTSKKLPGGETLRARRAASTRGAAGGAQADRRRPRRSDGSPGARHRPARHGRRRARRRRRGRADSS